MAPEIRALLDSLRDLTPAVRHGELIAYLLVKVCEGDWHGVADVANDLRVLEALHPEVRRCA